MAVIATELRAAIFGGFLFFEFLEERIFIFYS